MVSTLAGSSLLGLPSAGNIDGIGSSASFNNPSGIAMSSSGTLFVADTGNNLIRQITPSGMVIINNLLFVLYAIILLQHLSYSTV